MAYWVRHALDFAAFFQWMEFNDLLFLWCVEKASPRKKGILGSLLLEEEQQIILKKRQFQWFSNDSISLH